MKNLYSCRDLNLLVVMFFIFLSVVAIGCLVRGGELD